MHVPKCSIIILPLVCPAAHRGHDVAPWAWQTWLLQAFEMPFCSLLSDKVPPHPTEHRQSVSVQPFLDENSLLTPLPQLFIFTSLWKLLWPPVSPRLSILPLLNPRHPKEAISLRKQCGQCRTAFRQPKLSGAQHYCGPGLVLKYCLRYWKKNQIGFCTSLWIQGNARWHSSSVGGCLTLVPGQKQTSRSCGQLPMAWPGWEMVCLDQKHPEKPLAITVMILL